MHAARLRAPVDAYVVQTVVVSSSPDVSCPNQSFGVPGRRPSGGLRCGSFLRGVPVSCRPGVWCLLVWCSCRGALSPWRRSAAPRRWVVVVVRWGGVARWRGWELGLWCSVPPCGARWVCRCNMWRLLCRLLWRLVGFASFRPLVSLYSLAGASPACHPGCASACVLEV